MLVAGVLSTIFITSVSILVSNLSQVDQYIDLTISFFFVTSLATKVINDENSRLALWASSSRQFALLLKLRQRQSIETVCNGRVFRQDPNIP
jgi:hypothetical protein